MLRDEPAVSNDFTSPKSTAPVNPMDPLKHILSRRQAAAERCEAVYLDVFARWGFIGDGGGFSLTFPFGTTRVHAQEMDARKQRTSAAAR